MSQPSLGIQDRMKAFQPKAEESNPPPKAAVKRQSGARFKELAAKVEQSGALEGLKKGPSLQAPKLSTFPVKKIASESDHSPRPPLRAGSLKMAVPKMQFPISDLLRKRLVDPDQKFSHEESIMLIQECIEIGKKEAQKVSGEDLVVVIGNTGTGKSSFVNYLSRCQMIAVSSKSLGVINLNKNVVVVKGVEQGGPLDELVAIGHTKDSTTFIPQTVKGTRTFCDLPGFLDKRGPEIKIGNAVNISEIFKVANSVKVVLLVNYNTLLADRARGLDETIRLVSALFGTKENIIRYKDSIRMGISQIPRKQDGEKESLEDLQHHLTHPPLYNKVEQHLIESLAQNLFIYDLLDEPDTLSFYPVSDRETLFRELDALQPISGAQEIFKTGLSFEDALFLQEICDGILAHILSLTSHQEIEAYREQAAYYQKLQSLEIIDSPYMIKLLEKARNEIVNEFSGAIRNVHQLCDNTQVDNSPKIEAWLHYLQQGISFFDEKIRARIDLQQLQERYTRYKRILEAQKLLQPLHQIPATLYQLCDQGDFDAAAELLTLTQQIVSKFTQEYGSLSIKLPLNYAELEQYYNQAKEGHEEQLRSERANQKRLQEQERRHAAEMKEQARQEREHQERIRKEREEQKQLKDQARIEREEKRRRNEEAEEEKGKLESKVEEFRTYCGKKRFHMAQGSLDRLQRDIRAFKDQYEDTDVSLGIDLDDLKEELRTAKREDKEEQESPRGGGFGGGWGPGPVIVPVLTPFGFRPVMMPPGFY